VQGGVDTLATSIETGVGTKTVSNGD